MRLIITLILLLFLSLMYSCPIPYGYKYPNGSIPEIPVNIADANSEYDDINMSSPILEEKKALIFSSNRKSQGKHYDLVSYEINFIWGKDNGKFNYGIYNAEELDYLDSFLNRANTSGDEYGPYYFIQSVYTNNSYKNKQYFFYSSNKNGTNDINYMTVIFDNEFNFSSHFSIDSVKGPSTIPFLANGAFDEMYITFKMSPWEYDFMIMPVDNKIESIMYCDNSGGDFDIYTVDIPPTEKLDTFLLRSEGIVKRTNTILNSGSNDRCPYVCGNFLVFSSDRPGGLGGYDLYWSVYENGEWKTPVNFGYPINSSSNEYRAIADYAWDFDNQLIIFSSDRPGGKGGYDLYFAGFDLMPDVIR